MTNNSDLLTSGESVLATYTYGSKLMITNKRLIGKRQLKIGRSAFEGEILLDTVVDIKYSRGIPLVGTPSLFIEHKLPDGSVIESRIRFEAGPVAHRAFIYTPQQIYELIQDLLSQTADDDGMRRPSSSMKRQLEEASKRANRRSEATRMAVVFTISHSLTSMIYYNLLPVQPDQAGLTTLLTRDYWFWIVLLLIFLLGSLVFSTLIAAIPIYFLVDDSYLGSRWTIHWVIVGIVYALLWQFAMSPFHRLDISTPCLVDILLKVPSAGLSYFLVFGLFSLMRGKEHAT
jgi:hypothetical protein